MMTLISGPAIAKLELRSRKWAHESIGRGDFGPVTRRNDILYVALSAVEDRLGAKYSRPQLECASEGQLGRIILTSESEGEYAA